MESIKKLDTFILSDKYGLGINDILVEAHASAVRRADMMHWQEIDLRETGDAPKAEGEYTNYFFEIWGIDASGVGHGSDQKSDRSASSKSDNVAAKDVTI